MAARKPGPLVIKRTKEEEEKLLATLKKMQAIEKVAKNFKVPWTFGTDSAGELFVLLLETPADDGQQATSAGSSASTSGKLDKHK